MLSGNDFLKQSSCVPKAFGGSGLQHSAFGIYKRRDLPILSVPMNILINVILGIDMLVAMLMTLVILMQRPKSEGLGAAFGGGVTENIFGAQTTNVLTKFTGWLAGIFFVLTFVLGILYAQRSSSDSSLRRELMAMPTASPAASPAPATGSPGSTSAASGGTNVSPSATAKPSDLGTGVTPQQSAAPSPAATASATPQKSP
ncbi:MAG: preprotein translocase subunit SecG [Verrucomicrobia bacterium]|nr:MAG: preprotein translocase subunit SecG [Verrucomicrobiota bacterium]